MTDCAYCGCEVEAHDPVYVDETEGGERVAAGAYCNYGCLFAHIEDEGLATGTTCNWDPA
jgi:hypothetical protein